MQDGSTWMSLRLLLVERYDEFARRLTRRLGSIDLAEDALQDTFLRLAREGELGALHNPRAYLFRMAFNLAISRTRSEKRRLTVSEGDAFLDLMDDGPGPAQIVEGRSDLALVQQALAELPPRRRAIFEAAWIEDVPHRDIAAQHKLSLRMVQIELKHAADHMAERLARPNVVDFARRHREASSL